MAHDIKTIKPPLESEIQKSVLEWLQYNGIFAFRVNTMGVPLGEGKFRKAPITGITDIIGVIPRKKGFGVPLFIEIKRPKPWGGNPTEAQELFMTDADHAGAIVLVARSLDFVKEKLKPYIRSNF